MNKGKRKNIYGVKMYVKYEKKSIKERGAMPRPVVFATKKDYRRSREKRKMKKAISESA